MAWNKLTYKVMLTVLVTSSPFYLQAEELLRTTETWEGSPVIYPEGQAEITSFKLTIAAKELTKFHCHPVPTLGYILKGQVEVETKDGKTTLLKEGESAVEVLRTVHRGKAIDGAVEIIVFYAGTTDIPNTVLPENDPDFVYCNQ